MNSSSMTLIVVIDLKDHLGGHVKYESTFPIGWPWLWTVLLHHRYFQPDESIATCW